MKVFHINKPKGRWKMTLKQKVIRVLKKNPRRFMQLQEIYPRISSVGSDPGQQAAVRGLFNHDILGEGGTFQRHPRKPGHYKLV